VRASQCGSWATRSSTCTTSYSARPALRTPPLYGLTPPRKATRALSIDASHSPSIRPCVADHNGAVELARPSASGQWDGEVWRRAQHHGAWRAASCRAQCADSCRFSKHSPRRLRQHRCATPAECSQAVKLVETADSLLLFETCVSAPLCCRHAALQRAACGKPSHSSGALTYFFKVSLPAHTSRPA